MTTEGIHRNGTRPKGKETAIVGLCCDFQREQSKTNMFGVFNWPGVHHKIPSPAHDLRVNGEVHSRYSPPRYRLHSQLTTGTRLTIETGVYINHNEVVVISPHGSSHMPHSLRTSNAFMLPSGSSVFLPPPVWWMHQTHPEPFIGIMKLLSQEDSGQHPATSNMHYSRRLVRRGILRHIPEILRRLRTSLTAKVSCFLII